MSKTKYDPYIHGTTSKTLSLMSQSDFQLMPTLQMMDKYYKAPLGGELTRGGYSYLGKSMASEERVGAISFGKLYSGRYHLGTLTREYTKFSPPSKTETLDCLNHMLSIAPSRGYSNFNLILIYLTRARMMHNSLDEVIRAEKLHHLNQQLDATLQFYYFVQLLGRYIFPDLAKVEEIRTENNKRLGSFELQMKLGDILYKHLTFETIVQRIIDTKINVEEILANPTEENLRQALNILELPSSEEGYPTQFFCLEAIHQNEDEAFEQAHKVLDELEGKNNPLWGEAWKVAVRNASYDKGHFVYFSQNVGGYGIDHLLNQFLREDLGSRYFAGLAEELESYIPALKDRIRIFKQIINAPQNNFSINEDSVLEGTSFPVVLVSESDKIKLYSLILLP